MKQYGYGLSVIAKLKETQVKRNLYYEIKDKVLEEVFDKNKIVRKTRKTKVFGLHSTKEVRDTLIELLTERMRHHKDKFISPTIYNELRGLEVKKNGKVEHSDLTHDDQIFSYLMAMYVWYEGKNLRENFGIEKFGLKTEDSVDDVIDLQGTEELGDITEQIAYVNKPDQDKFEAQLAELQKAKGVMFHEFATMQRKKEDERLEMMLQNPAIRDAYARSYRIHPDAVPTNITNNAFGNQVRIPDSLFLDFNKDSSEMQQDSIYNMLNHTDSRMYDTDSIREDESQQ